MRLIIATMQTAVTINTEIALTTGVLPGERQS